MHPGRAERLPNSYCGCNFRQQLARVAKMRVKRVAAGEFRSVSAAGRPPGPAPGRVGGSPREVALVRLIFFDKVTK